MKQFFKQVGATLVGLFIFVLLLIGIASNSLIFNVKKNILPSTTSQALKHNSVLSIKFKGQVTTHKTNPFSSKFSLSELSYALKKAAQDPHIKGLFIEVSPDFSLKGYANIETILRLIKEFQKSNKPVAVYSQDYKLPLLSTLSSANIIALNPSGTLSTQGPSTSLFHYRGLLNRLGITPIVYQSGKNKNFGDSYKELVPTSDEKKHIFELLSSFYQYSLQTISQNKGIKGKNIEKINEKYAILFPGQAKSLNLIDTIAHKDDAQEELEFLIQKQENKSFKESLKSSTKTHYIDLLAYNQHHQANNAKDYKKNNQIVIIPLEGAIVDGKSSENKIGAEDTIELLQKYGNDDNVKAMILLIDSPGGSATASANIGHTIKKIAKRKPIVSLYINVAASAGVHMSVNSSWIIASEQTITGSIGSVSMRFEISRLLRGLGIYVEPIKTSPYGNINHVMHYHEPSEKEKAMMQNQNKHYNQLFRSDVIEARNLDPKKVEERFDGSVFKGPIAKKIGLIDQIGGADEAIEKAAELAGLQSYTTVYHKKALNINDVLRYLKAHVRVEAQQAFIQDALTSLQQFDMNNKTTYQASSQSNTINSFTI